MWCKMHTCGTWVLGLNLGRPKPGDNSTRISEVRSRPKLKLLQAQTEFSFITDWAMWA